MKKTSRWKKVISITLLALVCVGGAELLVCFFADPDLYRQLTLPVKTKVQAVALELQNYKETLWQVSENAMKEPPEEQHAGDPAIWTDLTEWDRTVTKFEKRGDDEILTGGSLDIFYFNQSDQAWSEQPYGSDTIGRYGCGPSVMAMAVSSLAEQKVNPVVLAQWAKDNGYWARKRGSYLSIVEGAAAAYGIHAEACRDFDADRIRQELASGKLIVALMSKGHFTQGGHFILLRGATLEGGILVADPSSRDRSLLIWDAEVILDELSSSRNDGAPLWILTPKEMLPTEN